MPIRVEAKDCHSPPKASVGEPLSPFDHFMLVDARPGYPMCFFGECVVEGDLEERRLRAAVDRATQRHPRFCSRVVWSNGRPHWGVPDVQPAFVWQPTAHGLDPWRPIDLTSESGVRIVVRRIGPRMQSLGIVVHHSVCDGIAACEFLGDMLACYEGLEPPDFSRLTSTETMKAASTEPIRAVDAVGEVLSFTRFLPAPLACALGATQASSSTGLEPPYASIELDESFTTRLRTLATSRKATFNDLIVAAVMRASISWNDRAGRRHGGVRVTMPVSTRLPRQRQPACNSIGYAFLDRSRKACHDRESLVRSLSSATRWILATRAVAVFLEAVGFLSKRPLLLKVVTRLPLCVSTVTVSNLGDVGRRMRGAKIEGLEAHGGLVIRGFRGFPPLRPRTRAAVAALSCGGSMTICCLSAAGTDPQAAGREFLDLIHQELEGFSDAMTTASLA